MPPENDTEVRDASFYGIAFPMQFQSQIVEFSLSRHAHSGTHITLLFDD